MEKITGIGMNQIQESKGKILSLQYTNFFEEDFLVQFIQIFQQQNEKIELEEVFYLLASFGDFLKNRTDENLQNIKNNKLAKLVIKKDKTYFQQKIKIAEGEKDYTILLNYVYEILDGLKENSWNLQTFEQNINTYKLLINNYNKKYNEFLEEFELDKVVLVLVQTYLSTLSEEHIQNFMPTNSKQYSQVLQNLLNDFLDPQFIKDNINYLKLISKDNIDLQDDEFTKELIVFLKLYVEIQKIKGIGDKNPELKKKINIFLSLIQNKEITDKELINKEINSITDFYEDKNIKLASILEKIFLLNLNLNLSSKNTAKKIFNGNFSIQKFSNKILSKIPNFNPLDLLLKYFPIYLDINMENIDKETKQEILDTLFSNLKTEETEILNNLQQTNAPEFIDTIKAVVSSVALILMMSIPSVAGNNTGGDNFVGHNGLNGGGDTFNQTNYGNPNSQFTNSIGDYYNNPNIIPEKIKTIDRNIPYSQATKIIDDFFLILTKQIQSKTLSKYENVGYNNINLEEKFQYLDTLLANPKIKKYFLQKLSEFSPINISTNIDNKKINNRKPRKLFNNKNNQTNDGKSYLISMIQKDKALKLKILPYVLDLQILEYSIPQKNIGIYFDVAENIISNNDFIPNIDPIEKDYDIIDKTINDDTIKNGLKVVATVTNIISQKDIDNYNNPINVDSLHKVLLEYKISPAIFGEQFIDTSNLKNYLLISEDKYNTLSADEIEFIADYLEKLIFRIDTFYPKESKFRKSFNEFDYKKGGTDIAYLENSMIAELKIMEIIKILESNKYKSKFLSGNITKKDIDEILQSEDVKIERLYDDSNANYTEFVKAVYYMMFSGDYLIAQDINKISKRKSNSYIIKILLYTSKKENYFIKSFSDKILKFWLEQQLQNYIDKLQKINTNSINPLTKDINPDLLYENQISQKQIGQINKRFQTELGIQNYDFYNLYTSKEDKVRFLNNIKIILRNELSIIGKKINNEKITNTFFTSLNNINQNANVADSLLTTPGIGAIDKDIKYIKQEYYHNLKTTSNSFDYPNFKNDLIKIHEKYYSDLFNSYNKLSNTRWADSKIIQLNVGGNSEYFSINEIINQKKTLYFPVKISHANKTGEIIYLKVFYENGKFKVIKENSLKDIQHKIRNGEVYDGISDVLSVVVGGIASGVSVYGTQKLGIPTQMEFAISTAIFQLTQKGTYALLQGIKNYIEIGDIDNAFMYTKALFFMGYDITIDSYGEPKVDKHSFNTKKMLKSQGTEYINNLIMFSTLKIVGNLSKNATKVGKFTAEYSAFVGYGFISQTIFSPGGLDDAINSLPSNMINNAIFLTGLKISNRFIYNAVLSNTIKISDADLSEIKELTNTIETVVKKERILIKKSSDGEYKYYKKGVGGEIIEIDPYKINIKTNTDETSLKTLMDLRDNKVKQVNDKIGIYIKNLKSNENLKDLKNNLEKSLEIDQNNLTEKGQIILRDYKKLLEENNLLVDGKYIKVQYLIEKINNLEKSDLKKDPRINLKIEKMKVLLFKMLDYSNAIVQEKQKIDDLLVDIKYTKAKEQYNDMTGCCPEYLEKYLKTKNIEISELDIFFTKPNSIENAKNYQDVINAIFYKKTDYEGKINKETQKKVKNRGVFLNKPTETIDKTLIIELKIIIMQYKNSSILYDKLKLSFQRQIADLEKAIENNRNIKLDVILKDNSFNEISEKQINIQLLMVFDDIITYKDLLFHLATIISIDHFTIEILKLFSYYKDHTDLDFNKFIEVLGLKEKFDHYKGKKELSGSSVDNYIDFLKTENKKNNNENIKKFRDLKYALDVFMGVYYSNLKKDFNKSKSLEDQVKTIDKYIKALTNITNKKNNHKDDISELFLILEQISSENAKKILDIINNELIPSLKIDLYNIKYRKYLDDNNIKKLTNHINIKDIPDCKIKFKNIIKITETSEYYDLISDKFDVDGKDIDGENGVFVPFLDKDNVDELSFRNSNTNSILLTYTPLENVPKNIFKLAEQGIIKGIYCIPKGNYIDISEIIK